MTFEQFAAAHGLIIDRLEAGKWVRTKTEDHPHKQNGAYFFDGDYAHVQNWATMTECVTWLMDKPMTPVDQAAMKKRMEAARRESAKERAQLQRKAAQKAESILRQCAYEQHAYLDSKGFPEKLGLVYHPDEKTNLLVIPMRVGSQPVGCQMIDIDGGKKFLYGQRCSGAEFVLGGHGIEIWCEGYATALSIMSVLAALKAPGCVHVCFSAGNMETMAKAAGKGFVVADNDISKTGELAAQATGLRFFLPPTLGMDFNDFHRSVGTFAASQALRKVIQQR